MDKKLLAIVIISLSLCLTVEIAHAQQPIQKKPIQKIPIQKTLTLKPQLTAKEECISFNPASTIVMNKGGNWVVVDKTKPDLIIASFGGNQKADADRTLDIIKKYGMNQICSVKPGFQYELVSGQPPTGSHTEGDCKVFNPEKISAANINGRWKIVEGNTHLFDFGSNETQARQVLGVIKKHGFTRSCTLGRPVGFHYMYKETQTASPIHLAPPRLPGPTGKIDLSREKDQGKDKPTLQIKAQKKPQIVSKEPMKKDLTKQVLTATAPGMKDLEFIIRPDRTEYGSIHPIRVIFTLTNHTAEALSVLKWYTPLEGLKSNILHVKRSGKSVPYVGIVAKRGIPLPKDYVTLGPGNSVSVEMDLSEGYDITTPGDYTAQLVSGVLRVAQQKPTVKVTQPKFVMKNLKSNTVSFKLIQERKSQLHLAPAALGAIRQTQKEAKLRPIHTETVGASNAQSSVLVKAHQNAVGLALNSRFNLLGTAANEKPNAEPYKTWFGSYDRDRWLQVTKNFDEIYEALHKRVVFDCTGQGCDPNWVAFVSKKNPYVIHICPLFWTTPDAGTDSKPGVIIHEVSHFNCVANTEDFAYNTSNCQYLANRNVDQAVQNADSHEYFAESLHTLKWEQLPDRSYSQYLHLRASNGFDLFGHADTGWVSIQDGTYPSSTFLIKNLTGNLLRSGDQVQLVLTDRTHYLSDNGTEVKANSTVAGQSETFQIIWATTITEMYQWLQQRGPIVHGDSVIFRTNKGTYLGLEHANDTAIEFNFYPRLFSNSEKIGDLERFKIFLPNMEPIGHGTWGMQKND